MAETAIASSPATDWGSLFGGLLGKVVDTAAAVTIKNADTKQQEVIADQKTETAKVQAAAAATSQATASTNWQRIALYAGIGLAGLIVVAVVAKSLRSK